MFLLARPLARLVLIVALVPTHAITQTIRPADLSNGTQLGAASLIKADPAGNASVTLAAGPVEESARRATRQLAQELGQPSGSDKKRLLLTGAALLGGGIGLMAIGLGDECRATQGFPPTICRSRSPEVAFGGLIAAGVGSVVLVKGTRSSTSPPSGSDKKRLLWTGAALVGGGLGLMAIGFGEECTTKTTVVSGFSLLPPYQPYNIPFSSTACGTRSEGMGWGGLTLAGVGSVVLANGAQRRTIPSPAPSSAPTPAPSPVPGTAPSPIPSTAPSTTPIVDLSDHIRLEDVVSITVTDGRRTEGRVTELTPSSLTLIVNEMDRRTFPLATVRRITVKDSPWNGALIGFVAGTIPAALFWTAFFDYAQRDLDGGRCEEKHSCKNPFPAGLAVGLYSGGLPGLGIGALIDKGIQRTINVLPSQGARVTVLPVISPDRQAVLVSIRF